LSLVVSNEQHETWGHVRRVTSCTLVPGSQVRVLISARLAGRNIFGRENSDSVGAIHYVIWSSPAVIAAADWLRITKLKANLRFCGGPQ